MDLKEKLSKIKPSLEKFRESIDSSKDDLRDNLPDFSMDRSIKRPLMAFSLALLLVFIGLMAFSDSSVDTDSETHVVEFTDQGFDPFVLEIDRGDTVRFVDNASITMWVASDPFPTNIGYSNTTKNEHCADNSTVEAFDQCSTGEVFEFTFEKSGEWGYHNQKPFASGGRIVVE